MKKKILTFLAVLSVASLLSTMAFAGDGASGVSPAYTSPGGNSPGGDSPGGNSPGGDSPGGDSPGGDSPGGDSPGGDSPGGDSPGGDSPGGDSPGGSPSSTPSSSESFSRGAFSDEADEKNLQALQEHEAMQTLKKEIKNALPGEEVKCLVRSGSKIPSSTIKTLIENEVSLTLSVTDNGNSFSISPDQARQILSSKKNQINFPTATLGEIITHLNEERGSLPPDQQGSTQGLQPVGAGTTAGDLTGTTNMIDAQLKLAGGLNAVQAKGTVEAEGKSDGLKVLEDPLGAGTIVKPGPIKLKENSGLIGTGSSSGSTLKPADGLLGGVGLGTAKEVNATLPLPIGKNNVSGKISELKPVGLISGVGSGTEINWNDKLTVESSSSGSSGLIADSNKKPGGGNLFID